MEMGFIHGQTDENMKVNILMIRNKEKEHTLGQMVVNIKDNGLMENSMEKVSLLIRKDKQEKGVGKMEIGSNGIKMTIGKILDRYL
jgi:hypothetical protein